jgi:hypothetical protein
VPVPLPRTFPNAIPCEISPLLCDGGIEPRPSIFTIQQILAAIDSLPAIAGKAAKAVLCSLVEFGLSQVDCKKLTQTICNVINEAGLICPFADIENSCALHLDAWKLAIAAYCSLPSPGPHPGPIDPPTPTLIPVPTAAIAATACNTCSEGFEEMEEM